MEDSLRNQVAEELANFWHDFRDRAPSEATEADHLCADWLLRVFDVRLREPQAAPNIARFEAMMRWLVDSGDMTPMAVRQLRAVLIAEVPDHPESVLDAAGE